MKYKNLAIFGLIFCFVNDQYFNASASVGINDFGSKHSSNRGSGVYDDNDGLSLDISETSSRVGSQKISPKISSVDVSLSRAIKVLPEIPKLPLSKLTGFNFDAKSQTGCVVQQRSINSVDMTDEVVYQQFHQYIARQYQGVYRNENEAESHTKKYLEKWHTLSKLAQDVLIYKALKNIQISSVYKGVIDRRSLSIARDIG